MRAAGIRPLPPLPGLNTRRRLLKETVMVTERPRYRFKLRHRQYAPGDLVPDALDDGTVGTMLAFGRIELIPQPKPHAPVSDPAIGDGRVAEAAKTIEGAKGKQGGKSK